MKYLDFEKHIKKELGNSREPVQMDALLASLNLGEEKPSKKGFALWMLIPFLLLIGSMVAWNYMGNDDSVDKNTQSSIDQTKRETENTTPNQLENLINTENATLSLASNQTTEIEAQYLNSNTENQNSEYNQDQYNTRIESTVTVNGNSIENARKTKISSSKPSKTVLESNSSSTTKKTNSYGTSDALRNSFIKQKKNESSDVIEATREPIVNPIAAEESTMSRQLETVEYLSQSLEVLTDEDIDGNMFSRMKINCPSFDNSGWHLALIPEVGVFKPFKTLENLSGDESAAFIKRTESESTLEGLEIGLYGMLVRDKLPFYLKAGVSYSRISERMDLEYEYIELDTTVGIISTTVSGNGDTITHIYGDIVTETTYKGSNRQHHYIHLFDFPVSIGYSTYIGGLDVGIEAGVRFNFMTRATGNLLVTQREYTNVSLNRMFKNRVGISYTGGLMIGRNFGKFGDIYIAPRFTYFPNDFNNQNNSIRQRYFNIGINAGVVYKIN